MKVCISVQILKHTFSREYVIRINRELSIHPSETALRVCSVKIFSGDTVRKDEEREFVLRNLLSPTSLTAKGTCPVVPKIQL